MEAKAEALRKFHLFESLPNNAQTYIMDQLPLIDVWTLCSSSRKSRSLCNEEYFQQRLLKRGGNTSLYQKFPDLSPIDKYTIALVYSKKVAADPSVVIYMTKSDILFPGLEYFIGLREMGLRAIKLYNRNDPTNVSKEYLLYVLKLYPDESSQVAIIGTLYLMELDAMERSMTGRYESGPNILPRDIYGQLMVKRRTSDLGQIIHQKYYPDMSHQYSAYRAGTSGRNMNIVLQDALAYYCGLIDGGHEELFIQKYRNLVRLDFPEPIRSTYSDNFLYSEALGMIRRYAGVNGSITMVNAIQLKMIIDDAIRWNNLPVVEYFFKRGIFPSSSDVYPGSVKMLSLMNRYGIYPNPEMIQQGAFSMGDYGLLSDERGYSLIQLTGEMHYARFARAPGYMLGLYFTRFTEIDTMNDLISFSLLDSRDLYRIEVLLSLGATIDLTANGIKRLMDNTMVQIFGYDKMRYPLISRWV